MSYVLALLGFVMLVILHEAGHFAAAKAVGMRVERFALFFPPLLFRKQIGETEYAIGAIPAGGYVKITGMNPDEKLPDEVRTRAYYSQPAWKRVVVIAAGPAVNFVLAAVLLLAFFLVHGPEFGTRQIDSVARNLPAAGVLRPNDRILAVDGHAGGPKRIHDLIAAHRCPIQPPRAGCRASKPVTLVVQRASTRLTVRLTPVYDASTKSMRVGFTYRFAHRPLPFGSAVDTTATTFWYFTKETVKLPLRVFDAKKRKEIGTAVGAYDVTRQTIQKDVGQSLGIIALISLSLAIINLFPFLPLDGGHIFWAIVEKVRRRPVPFSVMERASVIGFVLVLGFFFIGLSNDIGRLTGNGFQVR
ncbi:MAG: regulator of sigma protease [Thermoleophilaceae bacterium]|nr:regulator of sigma protease [Thermoleophilaceae bacterium]